LLPPRRLYGIALTLMLILVASACGGGGTANKTAVPTQTPAGVTTATQGTQLPSPTERTPIPTVTPRSTRTPLGSAEAEAAITALLNQGLAAIQARDSASFRALFANQAAINEAELNTLFVCLANATRTQDPPAIQFLSDLARATVKFQKTSNGQTTEVQGIWEFQKPQGGNWSLYIMPFCPQ